jgi:ribosomal protein S18 acetylase RimI-like enzyme
MKDFRFTDRYRGRNIDNVASLLIQPRLWIPTGDYPAHMEWREKALAQLASGEKRVILCTWGKDPVGSVVYQRHPKDQAIAEIRNLSVEPQARGRHVASFLLAQVCAEIPVDYPGVTQVVTDTKLANRGLIAFAIANGFRVSPPTEVETDFARNSEPDVLLTKNLGGFPSDYTQP